MCGLGIRNSVWVSLTAYLLLDVVRLMGCECLCLCLSVCLSVCVSVCVFLEIERYRESQRHRVTE